MNGDIDNPDPFGDKAPLPQDLSNFTVDWLYPAFHFVLTDQKKKPPLNSPIDLPVPESVRNSSRDKYLIIDNVTTQTFRAFKSRVRSRVNHNAFMVVYVYAPNRDIALRYLAEVLNIKPGA